MADSPQLWALAALLGACCWTDVRSGRIPNELTLGGAVVGVALGFHAFGPGGAGRALMGWFLALALLVPIYAFVGMGGGDVKLLAAVGALQGAGFFMMTLFHTLLFGLVVSVPVLLFRKRLGAVLSKSAWTGFLLLQGVATAAPEAAADAAGPGDHFPVAVLVAAGAFATWYQPALTNWLCPWPIR